MEAEEEYLDLGWSFVVVVVVVAVVDGAPSPAMRSSSRDDGG